MVAQPAVINLPAITTDSNGFSSVTLGRVVVDCCWRKMTYYGFVWEAVRQFGFSLSSTFPFEPSATIGIVAKTEPFIWSFKSPLTTWKTGLSGICSKLIIRDSRPFVQSNTERFVGILTASSGSQKVILQQESYRLSEESNEEELSYEIDMWLLGIVAVPLFIAAILMFIDIFILRPIDRYNNGPK